MKRYNIFLSILLVFTLCFGSKGQSQGLGYQISLYGNMTTLTQIQYTKGTLFVGHEVKSQFKPGFQFDVSVRKKSTVFIEPGLRLKLGYASHNTYIPIFYPEDFQNLTTSKYSSLSKEFSAVVSAFGKFKMKRIFVDLGVGYHTSLSHEINTLIEKGYDKSTEDRPDGESGIINGAEVSATINYMLKEDDKTIFIVAGTNYLLAKEKYFDPTSENIWEGYPLSLFVGFGYLW